MTPPPLRTAFETALRSMRWQLADATPRRIVCDSGFMASFRQILDCPQDAPDPVLADLHPSLGNLDHVAILIDKVRKPIYPLGTDFAGAQELLRTQSDRPQEQQYVRFAEEIQLPDKAQPDKLVLCMLPSQSELLLNAKRVEVDISFKRVSAWYEYEMVTWDSATAQSVTLCRAFMTSMSAKAHLELYRQIFRIAELDTGRKPRFCHLHGDGYEIWTSDDDRGHALGLGEFLVELARDLTTYDRFEPSKRLCDLTPYEHLARFLRLCTVHFKRNIKKLQGKVPENVYRAMWSLAATETLADFENACSIIRNGGKAAANWLQEKQLFALAALYQPLSKIPREIWLAGKGNTNGVEQMHRDVYRDGKSLTLLGGIQRGLQHDLREAGSVALVQSEGIGRRYNASEPVYTHKRSIQRAVRTETKRVNSEDSSARARKRQQMSPNGVGPLSALGGGSSSVIAAADTADLTHPFADYVPTQQELDYWETIDFASFM